MTEVRQPVPPAERTIPALLERWAASHGTKPLVRFGAESRSYAEVRDRAAGYGAALAEAGVAPGDRVALLCPNRLEFIDLWLGCAWRGAVLVPINTAARGLQLEHVLSNSDPRILVLHAELLDRLDLVETVLPSLEQLWVIGSERGSPDRWRNLPIAPFPEPSAPVPANDVAPGDTAAIMYTGGTTGPSKGVCCPHAQCYWWGAVAGRHLGVTGDSVLYTVLPLFHTNALNTLSQALVAGATFHFGERFSASSFWDEVREARATHTYLLGAMVTILLKRDPSPADRAHRVRTALAPGTGAEQVEPFEQRFGMRIVEGYGSTETNMTMCSLLGPYRPGSMGSVVDGFEARVVDDDDNEVPAGAAGELILRHREPFAFATGYFRLPEATVEAWRNLWFHTGDRVICDDDGVLWFVDRLKDAIRRRGENISSYEVEQVLQLHTDVSTAAVVPVPSELGEDEVMAFVVLRAGREADPVSIVRHCEPRLAYFAIPRYIEFVSELPLTEVGRVKKYELRARGVTATTWDRDAAGIVVKR
jgi:crotonobetaine/carnitine-CoA ligase